MRTRKRLTRIEFFFFLFVFAVVIEDIVVHLVFLTLESIVFARMAAFAFLVVGTLSSTNTKSRRMKPAIENLRRATYFTTCVDEKDAYANGVHG